jgi:hypothetical protein
MTPNVLAALTAVIIVIFIIDLLRRGVLKEKYAVLWLFFAGAALFFALVPSALYWLTARLGVETPSNLLFFITIVLLVLVSVQISYELSRNEAKIRRLAEEIALLEEKTRRLSGPTDE